MRILDVPRFAIQYRDSSAKIIAERASLCFSSRCLSVPRPCSRRVPTEGESCVLERCVLETAVLVVIRAV